MPYILFHMKELLRELVETPGITGNEVRIREVLREKVEGHADEVEVDDFGNLIARKGEGEKKLMIDAHMDQIGMGVRRIDDEGFLRVSPLGGAYPISIVNQRVNVHASEGEEEITGVIGAKPSHLLDDEQEGLPQMQDAFVDIGAESREDAQEKGVRVGDYISFDRGFEELANDYVTGPALDNRVGCAMAIEALKRFDDEGYELAVVFSAQEEVGRKGARTAAFGEDPDAAVVMEVARAGDVPNMEPDESDEHTGEGFGITMIEAGGRGVIAPTSIREWLLDTARDNDFDFQRKLYDRGKTNASSIEISRTGVPTGVVVIPTRHLHTAVEVISMEDARQSVEFLEQALESFEDYF
ncbi:MAG: M42 family metallopeptidase [Candidatus Nanohaloarchaea archaeon]